MNPRIADAMTFALLIAAEVVILIAIINHLNA
jgi:hypothetical protein